MQHRKSHHMTQEVLAEKIKISKNHLSGIERGIYIPTTQLLSRLCDILGETPDYYLLGKISAETDELNNLIRQLPEDAKRTLCVLLEAYLNSIHI